VTQKTEEPGTLFGINFLTEGASKMPEKKAARFEEMYYLVRPSEMLRVLNLDPHVVEGRLVMPYRYFPGPVATRFFIELRDRQKIMGIKCPSCGTVYVPPEPICGKCFTQTDEWVEVSTEGELQTYTFTHYRLKVHPVPVPVAYGVVNLDGANTGLVHLIADVDKSIKIGARVQAIFREKRQGNIFDILYFCAVHI
jgi:uncharacterized OB-fold protein